MSRSTIIFGNGLGMALDPDYFTLKSAMSNVWENPDYLTLEQKELITNCLQAQNSWNDFPQSEDDLDVLHVVVNACNFLARVASKDYGWLNDEGERFPSATQLFFALTAWHFHSDHPKHVLPDYFLNPLCRFIENTNSHIATLNYDNLLYQKLIEKNILRGYDEHLVDGFWDSGFREENLIREQGRQFGYYLHLHGTPLFLDGVMGEEVITPLDTIARPIKQKQIVAFPAPTKHLVLANVPHKPTIIASSVVLRTYWRYLQLAIKESKKIFIVGYSGLDKHLNEIISDYSEDKDVVIVEWNGTGCQDERINFWKREIKDGIELIQLENMGVSRRLCKWI